MTWTPPGFVPDTPKGWAPEGFVPDTTGLGAAQGFLREVSSPAGMESRWLRAVPYVAGAAGGVAGGIAGATIAGMGGKLLEQGMTGRLPKSPKEAVDTVGGAGIQQGGLEAGGQLLGAGARLAGRGLGKAAEMVETRAGNAAAAKTVKAIAAKDVTKDVAARLPALEADRVAAAGRTSDALTSADAAGARPITSKEVADRIVAKQAARFPDKATPAYRSYMRSVVKRRIDEVLNEYSLGAIKPPAKPVASGLVDEYGVPVPAPRAEPVKFDLSEANFAKQSFQTNSKAELNSQSRGIAHKPGLDRAIANAYKDAIEHRVPEARDLNQQTKGIIQDIQGVRKIDNTNHSPSAAAIRANRDVRVARTLATTPGPSELASIHLGLSPGVRLAPPRLAQFLSGTGRALGSRAVSAVAGQTPRAAASLYDLARPSPFFLSPTDTLEEAR